MINDKKGPAVGVICLCIVGAIAFTLMNSGSGYENMGDSIWIYNLETADLKEVPAGSMYPPEPLDGGTGYGAYVYTCTSCGDKDSHQIGFISKYSDEARSVLVEDRLVEDGMILMKPSSHVAATIEDAKAGKWKPYGTVERGIASVLAKKCGKPHIICLP